MRTLLNVRVCVCMSVTVYESIRVSSAETIGRTPIRTLGRDPAHEIRNEWSHSESYLTYCGEHNYFQLNFSFTMIIRVQPSVLQTHPAFVLMLCYCRTCSPSALLNFLVNRNPLGRRNLNVFYFKCQYFNCFFHSLHTSILFCGYLFHT